nr:uncharacterized protein LOC113397159 [Vanessa tameamea]
MQFNLLSDDITIEIDFNFKNKMKGLLYIFVIIMTFLTLTSTVMSQEIEPEPLLQRWKRETCEYRECDQFCRRLGLPGGACVRDKCDCDRF